jgi:hypothetical protein
VSRIWIELVDVSAEARELYGDAVTEICPDLPEHDWRFQVTYDANRKLTTGDDIENDGDGRIGFNRFATASEVAEYLKNEGIGARESTKEGETP